MIRKFVKPDKCPFCESDEIVFVTNMNDEMYCVCGKCAKTPALEKILYKSKFKCILKWNKDCKEFMSKVINR